MKSADRICLEGGAPCASRGRCEPQGFGGEWAEEQNTDWFRPILARTRTVHRPIGPVAYDCVKLIVVRAGSALLYCRHFKEQIISIGDVVLIGPGVLVGSEPEGFNTVTTVYLDTDYVVDQLYWQYVGLLQDRLDAQELADSLYCEPTQILRLGEERVGLLLPWLDELVALSVDGAPRPRFHRMQSLWLAIADKIAPYVQVSPVRGSASKRSTVSPNTPRYRRFAPLREEAIAIHHIMKSDVARHWTLEDLAHRVHLSQRQVSRLYLDAFGKTPLAHLRMLRVQEMARLLKDTNMSVARAAQEVGWRSRDYASEVFRDATGITPHRYRTMNRSHPGDPTIRTTYPAR